MRRTAVGMSLVLAIALAITGPANAASHFDPDDVEGPLDLRWGRGVVDPRWRVPNHDCLLRRLSRLSVANGAAQQPSRKRPG